MTDVFISYGNPKEKNAFSEGKKIANGLKDLLQKHANTHGLKDADMQVFVAPRSITPGANSPEVIMDNIRNCKWFLFVANKDSGNSPYAQQELGAAVALKKTVYPILALSADPNQDLHGFIRVWHGVSYQDTNTVFWMMDEIIQGKKKMLEPPKAILPKSPLVREMEKIKRKSEQTPPDDELIIFLRKLLGTPSKR